MHFCSCILLLFGLMNTKRVLLPHGHITQGILLHVMFQTFPRWRTSMQRDVSLTIETEWATDGRAGVSEDGSFLVWQAGQGRAGQAGTLPVGHDVLTHLRLIAGQPAW